MAGKSSVPDAVYYVNIPILGRSSARKINDTEKLLLQLNQCKKTLEQKDAALRHYQSVIREKDREIKELNNLLENYTNVRQGKKNSEGHEKVYDDYYKHYDTIEFRLPRKVQDMDKVDLWKSCCGMYQVNTGYTCQYTLIILIDRHHSVNVDRPFIKCSLNHW
jgi:hypothetical protein